jgi:hypothetical protein
VRRISGQYRMHHGTGTQKRRPEHERHREHAYSRR